MFFMSNSLCYIFFILICLIKMCVICALQLGAMEELGFDLREIFLTNILYIS